MSAVIDTPDITYATLYGRPIQIELKPELGLWCYVATFVGSDFPRGLGRSESEAPDDLWVQYEDYESPQEYADRVHKAWLDERSAT